MGTGKVDLNFGPDNCLMELLGNILTVKIDLGRAIGETKTGNISIATTGGNRRIGADGARIGVNVYRKVAKQVMATTTPQ